MRASPFVATAFAIVISPIFTGCDRPLALDQPAIVDNDLTGEIDAAPAVVVVPEPVAEAAVVVADPNGPIITAASGVAGDLDLRYNPATEITIRDVVLGKKYVKLDEDHTGVIVELQPGGDFIDVLAGTTKYLFTKDVELGIADPLMVTGSRIIVNGRPMLLAKTLTFRDREIVLRDENNYPLWREPRETTVEPELR